MTNLVTNVAAAVEDHGENTAIGFQGSETSYEEFWGRPERSPPHSRNGGWVPTIGSRSICRTYRRF